MVGAIHPQTPTKGSEDNVGTNPAHQALLI